MAAPESIFIRSFAGGELAPTLAARADLAQYQIGLRTCRNFVVHRHGGVSNRAGTRFINECKTSSANVRLIRYTHEEPTDSVLIEMGVGYFRFYQGGALVTLAGVAAWNMATAYEIGDIVVQGGVNYYCILAHTNQAPPNATYWYAMPGSILEIPHGFSDPLGVNYAQSGRILTFVHPSVDVHDLVHLDLTRWAKVVLSTGAKVAAPTMVTLTPGGTGGGLRVGYVVTAAHPDSFEESVPSAQVVENNANAATPAAPHVIDWADVLTPPMVGDPSPEYYVYKDDAGNGTYGFIGTVTGASVFRDIGLIPDYSVTPAGARPLFNAADERPSAVAYYQQRRFLANTNAIPDGVWASRVGFPDNYNVSSPLQDDDPLTFRIAGNNDHAVRHLVALKNILLMTDGGEWRLTTAPGIPLTPSNLPLDQETYAGTSKRVRPVVVGNSILYLQARDSIFRDLEFDQQVEGLAGKDLTIFATHLFDGFTFTSADYAQTPDSTLWAVRSDGGLLGLTYLKEQQIMGWHRHDTSGGIFMDVCVIPEPGQDAVYVLVRRTVGGATKRYIERLEPRAFLPAAFDTDAFFVDSGLSYSGAPVSSVTGLDHLEGLEVDVVADGSYIGRRTVSGGGVAFGVQASNVHVGLPIAAEIETLDIDVSGSSLRDKVKRPQGASVMVDRSNTSFKIGPSIAQLKTAKRSAFDPTGDEFSGIIEMNLPARWEKPCRVFIRQDQALPLTVLGVLPLVEVGG